MDYNGEDHRAKTARPVDPGTDERAPSDYSRNRHDPDSSTAPHIANATPSPGHSSSPTSIGSASIQSSTAVLPWTLATATTATDSKASLRKQINRKPVQRRATSESSFTADTASLSRFSTLDDTLRVPPPSSYPGQFLTSSTGMLLDQASRSLTCLTQAVTNVDIQDQSESPPPYVDSPTSSIPPMAEKRRNTLDEIEANEEPPNAIDLVRENRLDLLQRILEEGAPMDNVEPGTKRTAIMEAAHLRRIGAARILTGSGCRLHLKDVEGRTALHFASSQGDAEMCRILLDAGAQLDEYSNNGDTPLLLAARGGHTDVLLCLLNSWAAQMSSSTALLNGFLEATKSGNVRTAEVFIERGINLKKMQDSWRPVIYAAQSGSIPMIDLLLAHKCNLKQRDPEGRTALHCAAVLGHTAMVEKLLSEKLSWNTQTKKNQETALHFATLAQQSSTAMALILHKNANITMRDAHGVQALHHCVRNGDTILTNALLNRGARPDEQTRYGWTPMLMAAAYGHLALVAEFITRGVSLEERLASPSFRPREMTNEAARRGYWAEIRWPHVGARPLHLALEFAQDEVVNTLIAAGAKIEEGDAEGWKPLHYAAFNARVYMVELLLNRGASPHATTSMGNTPLTLGFRESGLTATYEEKLQVCDLLQAAMNAHKKSKFRKISNAINAPLNKSKEVDERNKIWHTAQLADALYQTEQAEYDQGDDAGQLTTTISKQYSIDNNDDDSGYGDSRTSDPPRITKTWTE